MELNTLAIAVAPAFPLTLLLREILSPKPDRLTLTHTLGLENGRVGILGLTSLIPRLFVLQQRDELQRVHPGSHDR
jgi:hypothetical protein